MIPYGRQSINQNDIDAVIDVLKSDFLTQGPVVPKFEQAVADYCHAKFGIAVNSGTAALHIACLALDVGPGDWVWTSPISFVASANCALYCGAQVDFVDIELDTGNMCALELANKLAIAEKEGKLPKVVIPVHFAGLPCDMKPIYELSQKYGFKIIEDACHALGAQYHDQPTGSCQYSDITVFSFHPVKIITTGEGGMAMTNAPLLAKKMRMLRSHGITREVEDFIHEPDGPWYYEQQMLGFNYRMTDIQAALGLSQMSKLDYWIEQRTEVAKLYFSYLNPNIAHCFFNKLKKSAFHIYLYRCSNQKSIYKMLHSEGIGVNVHYIPISRQPWHARCNGQELIKSNKFYESIVTLPIYPALSSTVQKNIIDKISNFN